MINYLQIARDALWLIFILSLFPLLASLIVGLVINFFQALTQIQDQTLSFVPKILITIIVLLITARFMLSHLVEFSQHIFELMLQVSQTG